MRFMAGFSSVFYPVCLAHLKDAKIRRMTHGDCTIRLCGETLVLHRFGAVWWPAEKTLVVADLHLEKGSGFARRGQLLPPYDTRATLARLKKLLQAFAATRVIALGDSFDDRSAGERLGPEDIKTLTVLTRTSEWLWVEGNHDPSPPAFLGGTVVREAAIGGLHFRHVPSRAAGEVAGHLHPAVRVSRGGASTRKRCFVSDGTRLILPAFGAYTGGLDVREDAITRLFPTGLSAYALGRERVYQVLARNRSDDSQPSATTISTVNSP